MESQPQNPEFRNNTETFTHAPCYNMGLDITQSCGSQIFLQGNLQGNIGHFPIIFVKLFLF